MSRTAALVREHLVRLAFAVAAAFLAFGPSLDSAAKAVPDNAPATFAIVVLRSFDVLDDTLDHLHGQAPAQAQLQIQLPHAFPEPMEVHRPMIVAATEWEISQDRLPSSLPRRGLERPPRA